ncbi:PspC domain protein [uncultured archaeon]|nr:PspC domain protein [uncultured archaeon]
MSTRIFKSKTDSIIDGVCGGLAEYFGIDSLIVRLVFVALFFIGGIGLILYIVLMIIMPNADKSDLSPKETIQDNVQNITERVKEAGEGLGTAFSKDNEEKHSKHAGWLGIFLILIGIIFLLDNFNMISWIKKDLLWPLIIIFIGLWLLIRRWR